MTKSMSRFRLSVFGFPTLYRDQNVRVALGMRSSTLLAILAIEKQPVSRVRLAELLWPDRAPDQARASLRQSLVELRQAFGALDADVPIESDGRTLCILPEAIESDLAAIDAAIDATDTAALTLALRATAPRPLLDEIKIHGDLSRWIAALRLRVETRISGQIGAMLDQALASEPATALELARARLAGNPACQSALRVLGTAPLPPAGAAAAALMTALPPISLPADAPPAIIVSRFIHSDDKDPITLSVVQAIREEIVAGLARFRDLRVVVMPDMPAAFAAGPAAPAAGFYLSASVRSTRDENVVAARLTSVERGDVLWSDRFHLSRADAQSAVDHIVERIVAAVAPTVETHLTMTGGERPAGALYARYLVAKVRSRVPQNYAHARVLADELEAILAQAPGFAAAHLPLARLYNTDFGWTRAMSSGAREHERAIALAHRALELDPGNNYGYTILGWCNLWRGEWGAARRLLDEAARLNPYHAMRLMEVGYGLLHLGDFDGCEAMLRRALSVSPVADDGFYFDLGMLALVRGDPLQACEYFAMIIAPDPLASIATALAAVQAGRAHDRLARVARDRIAPLWPDGRLPAPAAIRDWLIARHPFRAAEHRERYLDGLEIVLR
ncbi:MAG: hypothetical protein ACRCUI_05945 [Polymorphobacter sp.]